MGSNRRALDGRRRGSREDRPVHTDDHHEHLGAGGGSDDLAGGPQPPPDRRDAAHAEPHRGSPPRSRAPGSGDRGTRTGTGSHHETSRGARRDPEVRGRRRPDSLGGLLQHRPGNGEDLEGNRAAGPALETGTRPRSSPSDPEEAARYCQACGQERPNTVCNQASRATRRPDFFWDVFTQGNTDCRPPAPGTPEGCIPCVPSPSHPVSNWDGRWIFTSRCQGFRPPGSQPGPIPVLRPNPGGRGWLVEAWGLTLCVVRRVNPLGGIPYVPLGRFHGQQLDDNAGMPVDCSPRTHRRMADQERRAPGASPPEAPILDQMRRRDDGDGRMDRAQEGAARHGMSGGQRRDLPSRHETPRVQRDSNAGTSNQPHGPSVRTLQRRRRRQRRREERRAAEARTAQPQPGQRFSGVARGRAWEDWCWENGVDIDNALYPHEGWDGRPLRRTSPDPPTDSRNVLPVEEGEEEMPELLVDESSASEDDLAGFLPSDAIDAAFYMARMGLPRVRLGASGFLQPTGSGGASRAGTERRDSGGGASLASGDEAAPECDLGGRSPSPDHPGSDPETRAEYFRLAAIQAIGYPSDVSDPEEIWDEVAAILSEEDHAEEARAEATADQPSPLPSLSGASNDELDVGTDTSYELSEADFADALDDPPTSPLPHRSDVEE